MRRGIGVSVCPEVSVQRELTARRLAKLRWAEEAVETTTLMIWHTEKWCSPLLKHFMDVAAEVISK